MWVLYLNDMRSPKMEILTPVARASSRQALEAFLARNEVEPYTEDRGTGGAWGKIYRKGGPLEWFNRPYDQDAHVHFVDYDERIRQIREQVLRLPDVE